MGDPSTQSNDCSKISVVVFTCRGETKVDREARDIIEGLEGRMGNA